MLFAIAFYLNSLGNFALGIVLGALLGPAEFGGYATVALAGVTLAAATLDWLRFSALRYFSDPTTRADTASSLEAGYLYVVALVMALTLGLGLCGLTFGLSRPLFFMIPALAFALNRVDYAGAKFRASDRPHPFIWLFGLRQALYFTLTVGFAYVTRSAVATAGALAVSSLIAALALSPALRPPGAHWRRGRAQDLTVYLRYAKPIVASLVIYQIVWLINRHAALETLGPAITGKFSLASDVGQKLFMAVNSLPDFLLFQRVLRRDREEGRAAAWREVASNFTLMFALIAALTAGYVAMAPTFEAILVPVAYRGDFARLTLELAPGFCALSLIVSGVNPVFQLASRTLPLSVAAVIALGFNFADAGDPIDRHAGLRQLARLRRGPCDCRRLGVPLRRGASAPARFGRRRCRRHGDGLRVAPAKWPRRARRQRRAGARRRRGVLCRGAHRLRHRRHAGDRPGGAAVGAGLARATGVRLALSLFGGAAVGGARCDEPPPLACRGARLRAP